VIGIVINRETALYSISQSPWAERGTKKVFMTIYCVSMQLIYVIEKLHYKQKVLLHLIFEDQAKIIAFTIDPMESASGGRLCGNCEYF